MRKRRPHARIAITLPPDVLAAAERLARALDRSRSWVIAEAVRQFAARAADPSRPDRVREHGGGYVVGSTSGLGELRETQLKADLRLEPVERVRAAEATARLGRLLGPIAGQQLLTFDRPDDYLRWKQREAAGM